LDKARIKERAEEVNSRSLDFQLSHAVAACNVMIIEDFKVRSQSEREDLKQKILVASQRKDESEVQRLREHIGGLKKPSRIYVEYCNIPEDSGRVVKTEDNHLVISLPLALAEKSRDEAIVYNEKGVQELRRRTAHELGHVILHFDKLMNQTGLRGSLDLGPDEDIEANIFTETLLELRRNRNATLASQGFYSKGIL
jgi:Zn-dependent peptidase ImmA (M78 family)